MGAFLRAGQLALGAVLVGSVGPSCYSSGSGTDPPPDTFYFPVGLAVSPDGNVLYAANSDFDLQWNGGTLQTYDLAMLRQNAADLISYNLMGSFPDQLGTSAPRDPKGVALTTARPATCASLVPAGLPLGESCAPPVPSQDYIEESVIIGAFATDAQLSQFAASPDNPQRLFIPVRGEAAVTWANIGAAATDPYPQQSNPLFAIDCGQGSDNRCTRSAGNNALQLGNTRQVTMPGEPFGMAQSEDGKALAVTSQTDTKVSLLTTGLPGEGPCGAGSATGCPTMQFVLDGLPVGGVGIAAVPHDPDAPTPRCQDVGDAPPCVRPSFLETNRNTAEIDLLRYYDDDGSTLGRPYLTREATYPITSDAVGTDSRGIVIDPTPRLECKAQGNPPADCALLPARVFFASRTPAALGTGLIGSVPASGVGSYDPDLLTLLAPVSVPPGPSNVYIAPIVDALGTLHLRVFLVLFDSNQIAVYDPDTGILQLIDVGPGPFAMTFDPFTLDDVAAHTAVTHDAHGNASYRFGYVASFTQSYVQMIDLDQTQPTYGDVVFTLGEPTLPKGQ
jgi:hypothetical protein